MGKIASNQVLWSVAIEVWVFKLKKKEIKGDRIILSCKSEFRSRVVVTRVVIYCNMLHYAILCGIQ